MRKKKENLFWVAVDELTYSKWAKPMIAAFLIVSVTLLITIVAVSVSCYRLDKTLDKFETSISEMEA